MSQRREEIIKAVNSILQKKLQPSKIILFGSSAKKNNGKHSDFDFAVDGKRPAITLQRKISEEIEKISGLYKVDLVYLDSVDPEFKKIILETGRVLYESKGT